MYVPPGTVDSGKRLRQQHISVYHGSPIAGHFGAAKCMAALAQHYYCHILEAGVRKYMLCCDICQRIKPTKPPEPAAHPLPVPARPFEHITLNRVTGFPLSEGYNAVLNVADRSTKWAIDIPCDSEMKARSFCEALGKHGFHGFVYRLLSPMTGTL